MVKYIIQCYDYGKYPAFCLFSDETRLISETVYDPLFSTSDDDEVGFFSST